MSKQTHITALPNPVTRRRFECVVQPGKTIDELFPELVSQAEVLVNGDPLGHGQYETYRLGIDDIVEIKVFPSGSRESGKNIARTAALIAVAVASTAVGNLAGAQLGFSAALQAGVKVGLTVAGSALINTLIPPPQLRNAETDAGEEFNRMGALTGSRNRLGSYKVVPRIYGKHRLYPPLAAKPYTEIFTNKQYLRQLFCVGYGPLKLSEPKIGDTVIGSFDANNNFTPNGNFEEIKLEVGEAPGLFSNTVSEESINVDLNDANDSGVRTTGVDTDEISAEVVFPGGLFAINDRGQTRGAYIDVKFEIRETGSATWDELVGGSSPAYVLSSQFSRADLEGGGVLRMFNSARETMRAGVSIEVDRGQYDVRVTRITAKGEGNPEDAPTVVDGAQWGVLRSIQHSNPTDLPGKVMIAMKVRATDQLSGILDTFSVVAESRLATSDGSTWDEPTFDAATGEGTGGALSANPAWVFADVLAGGANARGIGKSRLDAAALKAWADWCATEGFEYNGVIDSKTTVMELAKSVAAAGRASYGLQDGMHTVVRDLDGQTPVQMFTPRNSWGFSATKRFLDNPHGLKVQFRNEGSDWKTEEAVVYNDGYSEDGTGCLFDDGTGVCKTATKFETLPLDGVTSWDQAWKIGRYRLAEARLRPETYSLEVDVENLVCQRGDTVKVAHDVTLWGSRWGRIKSVTRDGSGNVTEIEIDEPAVMESGGAYQVRIREDDGDFTVFEVDTVVGQTQTLTVTTPAQADIAAGDLFAFGEQTTETVTLKVVAIEPRSDLSARLTLVDEAPAIHDADTGSIPAFNPQITDPLPPLTEIVPPAPRIEYIRSDERATVQDNDGSYLLQVSVGFSVEAGLPSLKIEGRYRKTSEPDTWIGYETVEPNNGEIQFQGLEAGSSYVLQIRSVNFQKTSSWVEIPLEWVAITGDGDTIEVDGGDTLIYEDGQGHFVVGKKFPPRDVSSLSATVDKTLIRLNWTAVNSPDIKEYEIRKGPSWDSGEVVGRTDATKLTDQIDGAGGVLYHIKAIDTSGNYSKNATSDNVVVPDEFDELGDFFSYIIQQSNQILLKVDADGNITKIDLLGDPDTGGTKIEIIGDQVLINNINFDKDAGTIGSDNYEEGVSGWIIKGSGDAEFNNVIVRGELGDLVVKGTIKDANDKFFIDENGIKFEIPDDTLDVTTTVVWENEGTVVAQIGAAYDTSNNKSFVEYIASGNHVFKIGNITPLELGEELVVSNLPFVLPRLTEAERDALTVPSGTVIFNLDAGTFGRPQVIDSNGDWANMT